MKIVQFVHRMKFVEYVQKNIYYKDSNKDSCIHYKDIGYCTSTTEDFYCGSCEEKYELTEDKTKCEEITPKYRLLVGLDQ